MRWFLMSTFPKAFRPGDFHRLGGQCVTKALPQPGLEFLLNSLLYKLPALELKVSSGLLQHQAGRGSDLVILYRPSLVECTEVKLLGEIVDRTRSEDPLFARF